MVVLAGEKSEQIMKMKWRHNQINKMWMYVWMCWFSIWDGVTNEECIRKKKEWEKLHNKSMNKWMNCINMVSKWNEILLIKKIDWRRQIFASHSDINFPLFSSFFLSFFYVSSTSFVLSSFLLNDILNLT